MRLIDPEVHGREKVCDFLEANFIDPNRTPHAPFLYFGRKREVLIMHIVFVDGKPAPRADGQGIITVWVRYPVVRGREPRKYIGK